MRKAERRKWEIAGEEANRLVNMSPAEQSEWVKKNENEVESALPGKVEVTSDGSHDDRTKPGTKSVSPKTAARMFTNRMKIADIKGFNPFEGA
jgi:hypothetical protein